jgi:hypothetical protein
LASCNSPASSSSSDDFEIGSKQHPKFIRHAARRLFGLAKAPTRFFAGLLTGFALSLPSFISE